MGRAIPTLGLDTYAVISMCRRQAEAVTRNPPGASGVDEREGGRQYVDVLPRR